MTLRAVREDMEDQPWVCLVCTFENEGSNRMCGMCGNLQAGLQQVFGRCPVSSSSRLNGADPWVGGDLYEGSGNSREWRQNHGSLRFSVCGIPHLLSKALSGAFAGMLAIVGAFTGAVTGAIAGRATDCGLFRGAGLGAVAGAVLSIEFLEASQSNLNSQNSEPRLSMGELLKDVLSGRFIHEQVGPAELSFHTWQVNIDNMTFEELSQMFGPEGGAKGFSKDSLRSLPWHTVTQEALDSADGVSCIICLQDLQLGDTVRRLPHCAHMFHMECVDKWLFRHASCPVCRQLV